MTTNEEVRDIVKDIDSTQLHYTECFQTRKVVNAVLAVIPDGNADLDRFHVSSSSAKSLDSVVSALSQTILFTR